MQAVYSTPSAHGVMQGPSCSFSLLAELLPAASSLSHALRRLSRAAKGLYGIMGSRRVHQGAKGGGLGLWVASVNVVAGLGGTRTTAGFL